MFDRRTLARLLLASFLLTILSSLAACQTVTRRYVTRGMDAPDNRMSFLYREEKGGKILFFETGMRAVKRGIIQCERTEDGSLENCEDIQIQFKANE